MKKKYMRRSVLCFLLVLIQVFFAFSLTAFAADEEPKGVVASLSATTLEQDLTAAKVAEKDALYIEGQSAVSLVAFSAEKASATSFDLFFYLFSPKGFDDLKSAKVTLSEDAEGAMTRSVVGDILDRSKTLLKLRVSGAARKLVGYNETSQTLNIKLHSYDLTYKTGTVSYTASSDTFDGSIVNGYYTFKYSLKDGIVQSSTQMDTLELQVTLVSERVSSSDANTYKQINTAMMLIPESYFDRYGEITLIEYIYTLYDKVPMLVTSSQHLYDHILAGDHPKVGYYYAGVDGQIYNSYVPYKELAFKVDSIRKESGDYYDLTADEILTRFYESKDEYAESGSEQTFWEYIGAASISGGNHTVDQFDEIHTESYKDSAAWWQKLMDGRVFGNIDDSVDLKALHVLEAVDLSLTDEKLSETYCIDEAFIPAFRALAKKCKLGYRLVLMRYLVTDYTVYDCAFFSDPDGKGTLINPNHNIDIINGCYVAQNAIIEDFQILKIVYEKKDTVGNVTRTVIYPDNDKQDYVEPPESGDALKDDTTETLEEKLQRLWDYIKSLGETIRKVCLAIVICIGVVLVLRVITLLRDAFGRRYPKEDRPRRRR